ncbi:hypothetical protein EDD73_10745 [Heliophilum fasciatum]|uniref:Uncharacterized protein n=1 Tax=Heliophilum fasciatum TaxID=35700 RepID=A0A4R2S0X4_9FIRM|nr:hypothetical protein [Heliophilum fasciatum]TCP64975.1 hypothetical protein EDD73_10745 [Heliophilum fasciatum]
MVMGLTKNRTGRDGHAGAVEVMGLDETERLGQCRKGR